MEDRRLCPHCGGELHRKPYLMARTADHPVLPTQLICWVVVCAIVLTLVTLHG